MRIACTCLHVLLPKYFGASLIPRWSLIPMMNSIEIQFNPIQDAGGPTRPPLHWSWHILQEIYWEYPNSPCKFIFMFYATFKTFLGFTLQNLWISQPFIYECVKYFVMLEMSMWGYWAKNQIFNWSLWLCFFIFEVQIFIYDHGKAIHFCITFYIYKCQPLKYFSSFFQKHTLNRVNLAVIRWFVYCLKLC